MEKTYNQNIVSPFQPQMKQPSNVIDIRDKNHPVRDEIRKLCNAKYSIQVSFEEDTVTLNSFSHIPGLVSILCRFTNKDGQIIAYGRSCAVFSRMNRYMERTISTAINGSFLSASNNAIKIFEALRMNESEQVDKPVQYEESDLATPKQKSYLITLLEKLPSSERERWQREINNSLLTRLEASDKISTLLNK